MQLVLFVMIFVACIMVLKTRSSHNKTEKIVTTSGTANTFKEVGFDFRNKNVHEYLKKQAPGLRQVCQGTRKSIVWELPIEGSKHLKFAELVQETKFNSVTWQLLFINKRPNFLPFPKATSMISFQILKEKKEIYLTDLYPTFPNVSGVDILQFIMALSYACGFTLSLEDESDISVSYRILYGSGYYENLIKGMGVGIETINQNNVIVKEDFYNCANDQLRHLELKDPVVPISKFLNSCVDNGVSIQDCPVHFVWLGKAIHYNLMPICGLNHAPNKDLFLQPKLEFEIKPNDLSRIFNKLPPKSKPIVPVSYPIIKNCTLRVKDLETIKEDVGSLKLFKKAFDFCFHDLPIFTTLKLFTILRGCVTETLNFLWKYKCDVKEQSVKTSLKFKPKFK